MDAALIAETVGTVVYGGGGIVVARYRWTRDRPYKYPLNCQSKYGDCSRGNHGSDCFDRGNGYDSVSAGGKAAMFGLLWGPMAVGAGAALAIASPFLVIAKLVSFRPPEFEEEKRWKEKEGRT